MVRAAIVGCGRIAGDFEFVLDCIKPCTHMGAYKQANVEVVGVCDTDNKRLTEFSKRWGVNTTHSDHKELLTQQKFEILSICTDSKSHFQIVEDALNLCTDLKVIFCEKPIAYTVDEAEKILFACKQKNVKLVMNNRRRWSSCYEEAAQFIKKHKVYLVSANVPAGVVNTGSHLFDALEQLLDSRINAVSGKFVDDESNDPGVIGTVWFNNEMTAFVDCAYKENYVFNIELRTENGVIVITESSDGKFYLDYRDEHKTYSESLMLNAVQNIANYIEKGEELKCNAVHGLRPLEVALAFHLSDKNDGSKMRLPIPRPYLQKPLNSRQTSFKKDGKL